ncbi:MAG: hypothetical protein J6U29_03685 [Bacteroidales bacterium]|nr:hypothetical protein [Bacteroidales bacterium]
MKIKLIVFIEIMMVMNFVSAQKDSTKFYGEADLSYFPYARIEPYNIQGDTVSPLIIYDSTISQNIKGIVTVHFKFGNMADTVINEICVRDEVFRNIENIQIDTIKIRSFVIFQEDNKRMILSCMDSGQKKELFNYYGNKLYPFIIKNIRFSQMITNKVQRENSNFTNWCFRFKIIGKIFDLDN